LNWTEYAKCLILGETRRAKVCKERAKLAHKLWKVMCKHKRLKETRGTSDITSRETLKTYQSEIDLYKKQLGEEKE
jgi:hypothetical protein